MIIVCSSFALLIIGPKVGWCFVLPFTLITCLLLAAVIRNLWDDQPRIMIDNEGIAIRGEPKILWQTINAVRPEHLPRGLVFLVLELNNGKEHRFMATGFNVGVGQILTYIRKRLAELEEARLHQQSTLLQFGKYQSSSQSTLDDFAVAEWHPTEKDLDLPGS